MKLYLGALASALVLAACTGSASSSPSPAKPSAPAAPASAPAGSAPAKPAGGPPPSAPVVGAKAPGPYSFGGTVEASGGGAALEGTDTLKWQPNTVTAKAGSQVTLTINNTGNTAHTFVSPGLGVSNATDVATGKTTTVSFTAPTAPGAYQFWCNIPGHAEAGMVGEVIVQ